MYDCIINILFSDGLVKVYNCSSDYHIGDYESGILLLKVTHDESGLQFHTTVIKEKAVLTNLPKLMAGLTRNVSKFNSQVLTMTQNLKRNDS